MSYDGKLMRRAMVRFEEAKQRRADALHARERAVYAAVPRIAEIDAALRETMSKLISSALRRGTDPRPAIEALKEENLALQRERAELLVAHGYPADYLEDKPNCPLCGDTGWRGSEVCSCLNDYYARVQLEELSRLLDLGTQSFETFSFDVYSPYAPLDQDISPRSNMERIYDACRDYAYEFSPRSGNLLLSGDPGLGKTFLSACIARAVSETGHSVVYDTAAHIFERFEAQKFSRDETRRRGRGRLPPSPLRPAHHRRSRHRADYRVRPQRLLPDRQHASDDEQKDHHLHQPLPRRALAPLRREHPLAHRGRLPHSPLLRRRYPQAEKVKRTQRSGLPCGRPLPSFTG